MRHDRQNAAILVKASGGPAFKNLRVGDNCNTDTDNFCAFGLTDDLYANDTSVPDAAVFVDAKKFTVQEIEVFAIGGLPPPPPRTPAPSPAPPQPNPNPNPPAQSPAPAQPKRTPGVIPPRPTLSPRSSGDSSSPPLSNDSSSGPAPSGPSVCYFLPRGKYDWNRRTDVESWKIEGAFFLPRGKYDWNGRTDVGSWKIEGDYLLPRGKYDWNGRTDVGSWKIDGSVSRRVIWFFIVMLES
jgi:hypothetical protein